MSDAASNRRESEQNEDFHDPMIDEVCAIRKAISDEFDNDVRRLGEHLMELQKQYADRHPIVDRSRSGEQRKAQ